MLGNESLGAMLPEEITRYQLRYDLFDLVAKHPNKIYQNGLFEEHSYIIPTPQVDTRNRKLTNYIKNNNGRYFNNMSLLTIFDRDQGVEETGRLTRMLTGKLEAVVPEILIVSIRTQVSKKHAFSYSIHFVEEWHPIPEGLFIARHRPDYNWGTRIPRAPNKKYVPLPITQNNIDVFTESVSHAVVFTGYLEENPDIGRKANYHSPTVKKKKEVK